jgi:four helix bundle protein
MNDPEVTMNRALPKSNLIAYGKALDAAAVAISLVRQVPAPVRVLADQVIRSASSVPANLAEGHGRSGRDRFHHWRIAYGSAKEVDCHLRLLMATGAIDHRAARSAVRLFDEARAMT